MNTDTPTANQSMQVQVLNKIQALVPVGASLLIVLPCILASYMMMQTRTDWPHSGLFVLAILGLMATDFLMLFVIEPYRGSLGDLTIPSMIAFIGITVFFLMNEAINRFVVAYGFGWLTPIVITGLAICYAGVVRERYVPLKFFLCLNGLAMTILWCLGDAGRMTLPF